MEVMRKEAVLHHFSHDHPLGLTNSAPAQNARCFGCKLCLLPGTDYYHCKSCPFLLHRLCFNMPRKLQLPAHPDHCLTLLAPSSSFRGNSTCKACEQQVNGSFHYSCAVCSVSYHALCAALPPSIAIATHPHVLKLVFSLPHEFRCDLCNKPSYRGWVYRCNRCRFNNHLTCAISCYRADLTREEDANKEIMQLLAQKFTRSEVAKPVEMPSPLRENVNIRSAWTKSPDLSRGKLDTVSTLATAEQTSPKDKSPLLSEGHATPSHQFSDAYFSIDLAKSYSSYLEKNQPGKGAADQDATYVSGAKEKMNSSGNVMPDKNVGVSNQEKQQMNQRNTVGHGLASHYKVPDARTNQAFVTSAGAHPVQQFTLQMDQYRYADGSIIKSLNQDQCAGSAAVSTPLLLIRAPISLACSEQWTETL
ncbi:uncharacterized protein LOC104414751 [Eucalyptus grandis]|uniref:uncharacterized protein LOC104414751 n=1 Tax=Eucalyptus grandis TaxID=71139 RepID=UPI00192EAEDC|nr:uncharacterized protein LOC104414751 [Eucalyptus grandis]